MGMADQEKPFKTKEVAMTRIANLHTLTRRLIVMTAISMTIMAGLFAVTFFFSGRFMLTWAAFIFGIIGGFVSIQQRVKNVSDEELKLLCGSWFQILLVPIFGGIFALVLYTIFIGGIITGAMFPEFQLPLTPENGVDAAFFRQLLTETYPKSGEDLGKFIFWSFAAGFSERLVPQIITKTTSSAAKSNEADRK